MDITIEEFKKNPDKYLELVSSQDIYLIKDGKKVAKLTKPSVDKKEALNALIGVLDEDVTLDQIKGERLKKQ